MTEPEFPHFQEISRESYAQEKTSAERVSIDCARKIADDSFKRLLPDGVKTKNHYLFNVCDSAADIGWLWFGIKELEGKIRAFLYQIDIHPEAQGRGLGRELMEKLELEVHKVGGSEIALHVFSYNDRAIRLYKSLGYQSTDMTMFKELS